MDYKTRLFVFTDFRNIELWCDPITIPVKPRWCVWQIEVCPETNREHVQGALYWDSPCSLKESIRRMWGEAITGHMEAARGTVDDQVKYCTKDATRVSGPWEIGERPAQGKRSDLRDASLLMQQGRYDELDEMYGGTAVRYFRHLKDYAQFRRNVNGKHSMRNVTVEVLWGKTGVGKSAMCPIGPNVYWGATLRNDGTYWFNGYEGESTIVLDEFTTCNLRYFLRMCDGYPFQVETKGGHEWASWDKVIITSNYEPLEWFPNVKKESMEAVLRRLTYVTEVTGNTESGHSDGDIHDLYEEEVYSEMPYVKYHGVEDEVGAVTINRSASDDDNN